MHAGRPPARPHIILYYIIAQLIHHRTTPNSFFFSLFSSIKLHACIILIPFFETRHAPNSISENGITELG